jgi:selenocysteine lyase/cysteine desulfurase
MSIVEEVGVPAIETHVGGLNGALIEQLGDLGATVVTPVEAARRGPLVCVRSTDVERLWTELRDGESIVTSHRDDCLRIATHLYNTQDDIDRVVAALAARRPLLA